MWTDGLPEWLPMADAQPLLQRQEEEEEEAAAADAGAEPPAEEASLNFRNSAWPSLDPHAHSAEQQPLSTAGAAPVLPAPIAQAALDPFGPPPAWDDSAAWGDAASSGSSSFWQSNPFGAALDEPEVAIAAVAMAGTNPFAPGAPFGDEASIEAGAAPVMGNPFGAAWGCEGAELAHSPGPREEGGDGGEAGGDASAAGSTAVSAASAAASVSASAVAASMVVAGVARAVVVAADGAAAATATAAATAVVLAGAAAAAAAAASGGGVGTARALLLGGDASPAAVCRVLQSEAAVALCTALEAVALGMDPAARPRLQPYVSEGGCNPMR